jgi:hypothetical protein
MDSDTVRSPLRAQYGGRHRDLTLYLIAFSICCASLTFGSALRYTGRGILDLTT